MSNEQMEFSEIQRLSNVALEAGDLTKLQKMLLPLLREDDRTRKASENLFVYRTLGAMYKEQDSPEEALVAYRQAHSFDPRDMQTLEVLAEDELRKDASQANTKLLQDYLIFHRESLKNSTVMRIFKHIGDADNAQGRLDDAREYYEKALDVRPGDMDLINALLKVSEASGNEEAIRKSREKLLNTLSAPESRAAVLVGIGDDYLNNRKDEKSALEMYEEAIAECSSSTAALQRILVIGERSEDWDRALNASEALVKYSTEDEEKCKYLLKEAWIFKEKFNNSKRAIQLFNEVLDLQPEQIDVFQGMIAMQQEMQDFLGIEANYEAMIERQRHVKPLNTKLLAVLCKNLGELRIKLNNVKGAAQAYKVVSELYPDNVNLHVILAKLYEQNDDTLEDAIAENRAILRLSPDHLDSVTALAKCYRRLGRFDESLCIYRVLDILGMNDDEGRSIVSKFASDDLPQIANRLTDEQWRLLCPSTLDSNITSIFRLCLPAVGELFMNDLDRYGISARDSKIDISENTLFTEILKSETMALGFADTPDVYRCDKFTGVTNAYLTTRAFLVNSNFLRGRSKHELAFATAKALLLMRPEYYLLQLLGIAGLDTLMLTIIKTVYPSAGIELDKNMTTVSRSLSKNLSPENMTRVREYVELLQKNGKKLNLRLYMESVDTFCNRVGLLFCNDLTVVEKMLAEESRPVSPRSAKDRLGTLLLWALSEDYTKLRQQLGITIQG